MFKQFPAQYKAILLALVGYSAFSLADTGAKWLTPHYGTYQIVMLVQFCAAILLLCGSHKLGGLPSLWSTQTRRDYKVHILRGILNAATTLLLVYAFSKLPLVTIYTACFTKPFVATVLGVVFFSQTIGKHRAIATVVGFIGILIAFQPWTQSFPLDLSLVLIALPLVIAGMFIAARGLTGGTILSLGFWPVVFACLAGAPMAILDWHHLDWHHIPVFFATAACSVTGVIAVSRAFQLGDSAAITPMMYIEMLWGLLIGYFIFGDTPDINMMAGSIIIVLSGLYLILKEKGNAQSQQNAKSA